MTTDTATTTTTAGIPAEPPCALTGASLEALAAYEDARAERQHAHDAFKQAVSPEVWRLFVALDGPEGAARDAELDLHVAELCRHLPGLAPTIRLLWAHVIDTRLDRVGACCAADGPIEP